MGATMSVHDIETKSAESGQIIDAGKLDTYDATADSGLEHSLRLYFRGAPNLLAEIENGMAAGDITAVAGAAQMLAANSDAVGAVALAQQCRVLESQANEGDVDTELVGQIAFAYDDAASALEEELERRVGQAQPQSET